MIRTAGPQDVPFLRDMLRHAYYWRVESVTESGEPPVQRYVERWGRPGDTALIAIHDFQRVGAAWYRLFTDDNRGYGFVDEETPELSIAIVPNKRGTGLGSELLDALLDRARADGYDAITLSVEKDSPAVGLYERHGFERLGEDDGGVTMKAESLVTRARVNLFPPGAFGPLPPLLRVARKNARVCDALRAGTAPTHRPRRHATHRR